MSMIFGFLCLIGAVALFLVCLPKAVKDCGLQQRTTRLKHVKPVPKCSH